jgi:glycine hydroxymethyltransferase
VADNIKEVIPEFLLVLKENGHVIGSIDYKYIPVNAVTEVGYGMNPHYQGQGYMSEALTAFLKLGQRLGIKTVLADTLKANGVRLVSGGTDNHLMLADVMSRGKTGNEVQGLLDAANITANKNAIPFDTQPVKLTSGMRFGSPAVTTRGMKENEMRQIGNMISRLMDEGEAAVPEVKQQVIALCKRFPLYPEL